MDMPNETTTAQPVPTPVDAPAKIETTSISFDRPEPTTEEQTPKQEATDAPPAEGTQEERDEKGRFKGVQPRIDELTRKRHEAEREANYWRQLAQSQAQPSAQAAPQKPTPDKFDDYGEYVEALTDWKADQAVTKRMEQDSSRKAVDVRTQTFTERQATVRAVLPDYDAVVGASEAPISDHVSESLMDSDRGPELAYHFAKNPDILQALNGMSATQAAREIGKLEATLPVKTAPAAPSAKLSATPAPANTSTAQGRATKPTLATASMDEYMAQRKSQGARWAR